MVIPTGCLPSRRGDVTVHVADRRITHRRLKKERRPGPHAFLRSPHFSPDTGIAFTHVVGLIADELARQAYRVGSPALHRRHGICVVCGT